MENTEKICRCCICGQMFIGFGNNPWPIVNDDDSRCCDDCNTTRVVPERINLVMGYDRGTEQSK